MPGVSFMKYQARRMHFHNALSAALVTEQSATTIRWIIYGTAYGFLVGHRTL